jgi:uncharacterized damage-inducible protein DinB
MRISDALVPELDQETATTRRVLERCPEDKFGWKPHAKSFSMAGLCTHIANMLGWGVDTINKDSFDVAPVGAEPYKEEPVATNKELLERFDKNSAAFRAALVAASDEQLMKNWSLLSGGQTIFTMPRVAILRGMILNHIIHHRGQLSVYLRLNDIPVPSIYGPSADESPM